MLETRSLCKTYKPKKGVPVLAVDHVSLRFPETGMVFLLGKSGSGKSTMLNLLGGLDKYDGGEIIIKGISSEDFSQQRFDSYRNTYVGFIFQEYNVLEEFTVGANIALALELQGKKATDDELNRILQTVGLAGYGSRKPNELSGGQKQRVAIARALVKNPEIIMADEPTGALDSATGRQILDTLKKLSAEKLVIVVSHDREYAEAYADRIIELADGKVIRDVERTDTDGSANTEKMLRFRQTSIEIPTDYHLTEEDRIQINEYLDKLKSGASLMMPSRSQNFAPTNESVIPVQDGSKFNLIKSKLPMGSAFKIGCSSLKHKRFRLVMTILLSVAAFTLFALVDTFSAYDHINACTDSIIDSGLNYLSVNRKVRTMRRSRQELDPNDEDNYYYSTDGQHFTDEQIAQVSDELNTTMTGIFVPVEGNLRFTGQFDPTYSFTKSNVMLNLTHFCGFAEVNQQMLDEMHFDLVAGSLPRDGENEIAISALLCETFEKAGYLSPEQLDTHSAYSDEQLEMLIKNGEELPEELKKNKPKYETISSKQDMVGKKIRLMGTDYTVTGVVDTHLDLTRYQPLIESQEGISNSDEIVRFMLQREFSMYANYSLTGCAMVGKNIIPALAEKQPQTFGCKADALTVSGSDGLVTQEIYSSNITEAGLLKEGDVIWVDGEKTTLADNEIIVSLNQLNRMNGKEPDEEFYERAEAAFDDKTKLPDMKALKSLWAEINLIPMELYALGSKDDELLISKENLKIVGVFSMNSYYADQGTIALSPKLFAEKMIGSVGTYDSAIGAMPEGRAGVEDAVRSCLRSGIEKPDYQYEINSAETLELNYISDLLKTVSRTFLWVGVGFAVFAGLLMANFITTSIHYKRQEIGILRSIGSRSADVFRIFFSESFVIAMINFAVSAGCCAAAVAVINYLIRQNMVLVTILHFGLRQLLLLIAVSISVAALASFLPVRRIASKKPIDAIRDK